MDNLRRATGYVGAIVRTQVEAIQPGPVPRAARIMASIRVTPWLVN